MIKHTVCFKLKDNSDEMINKTVDILRSMDGNVPMLKGIEVGKDFLGSSRSYDIILTVTLESPQKLDEYQQDSYHCNVVKKHMHSVIEASVAVDYEI